VADTQNHGVDIDYRYWVIRTRGQLAIKQTKAQARVNVGGKTALAFGSDEWGQSRILYLLRLPHYLNHVQSGHWQQIEFSD